MKYIFLMNPHACSDKTANVMKAISDSVENKEYSIVKSEKAGDLTEIARKCTGDVIFSLGGDGTLFEIVNGMAESTNAVCVIPAGSGNDFCRMTTSEKDYRKVLLGMDHYSVKQFDCGKADDLYFSNIASVGYDAEIVKNAAKFKRIPGLRRISYIIGLFYTLFTYKGISAKITIDGTIHDGRFLLCAVSNGQYYGGGIRIAPKADPRDGLFDVILIDELPMLKLFFLLPTIVNGTHLNVKYVHLIHAKQVQIESGTPFALNLDGELMIKQQTSINIIENGLNIFC